MASGGGNDHFSLSPSRVSIRLWLPVLLYMAAIFFVSSLEKAPLPEGIPDKGAHWLGYLGLGVLVVRALAHGLPARITLGQGLVAMIVNVAYAATDEYHQLFVPGRSADINDVYADALGAAAGIVVCWAWGIISRRSNV